MRWQVSFLSWLFRVFESKPYHCPVNDPKCPCYSDPLWHSGAGPSLN